MATRGSVTVSLNPTTVTGGSSYTVSWSASATTTNYQTEVVPVTGTGSPDFSGASPIDEGTALSTTSSSPTVTTTTKK